MNNSVEMYHYGIKGMRWGVRRKNKPLNIGALKSGTDSANNIVREGRTLNKSVRGIRSKKTDLSKMTDDELRAKVNRMNLEQQYDRLSSSETSRGRSYVDDTLSIAGSALAITSSALGIALAMKQLMG